MCGAFTFHRTIGKENARVGSPTSVQSFRRINKTLPIYISYIILQSKGHFKRKIKFFRGCLRDAATDLGDLKNQQMIAYFVLSGR